MSSRSLYLYDSLNNEHPRKNLYLRDLILASSPEARKELIKNKETHPYIVKYRQYLFEKKKFEEKLKREINTYRLTLSESDKYLKDKLVKLYENQLIHDFYKQYEELDWDASYRYQVSLVYLVNIPEDIETYKTLTRHLSAFKDGLAHVKYENEFYIKQEIEQFCADQKKQTERKIFELHQKMNDGLISKKATKNEIEQLKKFNQDAVLAKQLTLPSKMFKEQINSLNFQLKEFYKLSKFRISDTISDIRRKTPVEYENDYSFIPYATAFLPGLGQLFNKQFINSIFFFLGSIYIYLIAIPYALGYGNYRGKGLIGLFSLANGGSRLDRSLVFMIEGIIAIALLAFALVIFVISFKSVKKVRDNVKRGTRPFNFFETLRNIEVNGFPYVVSLPALILIVFIVIVPIMTAILLSFSGMDPQHQTKFPWIGLQNYGLLASGSGLAGSVFWKILGWTLIWTLGSTSLAIFIGFGLALIANNDRIKGKAFFRTVYLLPWAIPAFITIMFFSIMFSPNGILTHFISNIFGSHIEVKNSTTLIRLVLILIQGWLGSSYVFLLSTGVLQGISHDLYEAADIDGASSFQKLTKITIPLVLFQTAPLLIGQYTFNFNNYSIIALFNDGGPFNPSEYGNLAGTSDLLISYIYKLTMSNNYQAIGAAISVFISISLMVFTFIGYRRSKAFKEDY